MGLKWVLLFAILAAATASAVDEYEYFDEQFGDNSMDIYDDFMMRPLHDSDKNVPDQLQKDVDEDNTDVMDESISEEDDVNINNNRDDNNNNLIERNEDVVKKFENEYREEQFDDVFPLSSIIISEQDRVSGDKSGNLDDLNVKNNQLNRLNEQSDDIISEEDADAGEENDSFSEKKNDLERLMDQSENKKSTEIFLKEPDNLDLVYDDYQVEDNRSDTKEEEQKNDDLLGINDNLESFNPSNIMNSDVNYQEFGGHLDDNQMNNEKIVSDAKQILEEENGTFEEDIENKVSAETSNEEENKSEVDRDNEDGSQHNDYFDEIIENKLNKEIERYKSKIQEPFQENESEDEDAFKYENEMIDDGSIENLDVNNNNEQNLSEQIENAVNQDDSDIEVDEGDEDTDDKVYKDLNADLDTLFATWSKLTADDSKISSEEAEEVVKNDAYVDGSDSDDIEEYEEKYSRPYKEGVVLQQRDDLYADINDNDSQTVVSSHVFTPSYFGKEEATAKYNSNEELTEDFNSYNLSLSDEYHKNGGLLPAKSTPKIEERKEILEESTVKFINVDKLNKDQYLNLMSNFLADKYEEMDSRTSAPINMYLDDDETVEIESPNYPNSYPTNNVVDWIVQGNGNGIELNITDLELRGAQGDYLLIRPGGDSDGPGGLVFSYHLTQPQLRHYRFADISSVFIRFVSGAGLNVLPGFHLTVKQIWRQQPAVKDEEVEPEPLKPGLGESHTVHLGIEGYVYQDFETEFRRLIADMATMYINANRIDPGLNTTYEVTYLSTGTCMKSWPNAEKCVSVTFEVPLVYEEFDYNSLMERRLSETDLITMWNTYVGQDPFAARLRAMGITQFPVPDDRQMMMYWVLLTVAVIIAAAIAGFGLWRYSYAEDYTRMKDINDTGSIHSGKRGLDLYPTPHQPLPPLYADNDLKWADAKYNDTTRVDVGGHANRSYARDELLDIDSDEEGIAPRDRNAGFSPRNVYEV